MLRAAMRLVALVPEMRRFLRTERTRRSAMKAASACTRADPRSTRRISVWWPSGRLHS